MTQKIKHYICEKDGRIKWQFRLILSAAILSIMLAESRFLYYHSPKDTKWLICIIYALTGYYCPGCGAVSRVLLHFARSDFSGISL